MIGSDLDRALCPPIYSSPSQQPSIVSAATSLPVLHSSPRQWNPRFVRIYSQTEKDVYLRLHPTRHLSMGRPLNLSFVVLSPGFAFLFGLDH